MAKNYQLHCFCFLLLQAANVHAGINGIHIAIMILEDWKRCGIAFIRNQRAWGEFLLFQNECAKNLFKTFYKANYHRKAKRTETTEQSSTQTTTAGQTAPQTTTTGQTAPQITSNGQTVTQTTTTGQTVTQPTNTGQTVLQIDRNKCKAACGKCLGWTKNDCRECVNCLDK